MLFNPRSVKVFIESKRKSEISVDCLSRFAVRHFSLPPFDHEIRFQKYCLGH